MNATTVAVDLAKNVFEVAVADGHWKVIERARLTRPQFERWFQNRDVGPGRHGGLRFGALLGQSAARARNRSAPAACAVRARLREAQQD